MSKVNELLKLFELIDSIKEEYRQEIEDLNNDDLKTSETKKVVEEFLEDIYKKDSELQKIYNDKGKHEFEQATIKKYPKEIDELTEKIAEKYIKKKFEPFEKKIKKNKEKIDEYPKRSIMLAKSLHYGKKGA